MNYQQEKEKEIEQAASQFLKLDEIKLYDNFIDKMNENQKIIQFKIQKYSFLDLVIEKNELRKKEHDARVAAKKHKQQDARCIISNRDLFEQPGPGHYDLPVLENSRKIPCSISQYRQPGAFDEATQFSCTPGYIYQPKYDYVKPRTKVANLSPKIYMNPNKRKKAEDERNYQLPSPIAERQITIPKEQRFGDRFQKLQTQMGKW